MRAMVRTASERMLWVSKLSKNIEYGKERSETLVGMSSSSHFVVKITTNIAKDSTIRESKTA